MQLTIKEISKKYSANKFGLFEYSLDISPGILGLLGPNGAGKSTLIKIIATISKPTAGHIYLDDVDLVRHPNEMRKLLGYLPQDFGVYPNLNAYEFLHYIAALKGIGGKGLKNKIVRLLEGVNLIDSAKNLLGTYSGGMIQRIGIAQALLNNPKVIIFDEPTVGLDPEERLRFRDLLSDLATDSIIILSSHIVSDIESIADNVVIMESGQLILKKTQEEIKYLADNKVFMQDVDKHKIHDFKSKHTIVSSYRKGDVFEVRYITEDENTSGQSSKATLEDAYILLTKHMRKEHALSVA